MEIRFKRNTIVIFSWTEIVLTLIFTNTFVNVCVKKNSFFGRCISTVLRG